MLWVKGQIAAVIMNTRLEQESNVTMKKKWLHIIYKKKDEVFFLALLCKFGLNTMIKHIHHPSQHRL